MSGKHTLIIVGHLGKDPEMRYIPSGTAITTFNVATSREYTKNDEKIEETNWFRVSAWGKQAEACATYLKKGSLVLVEGSLTAGKNGGPEIWMGKDDNLPHANFEVRADSVTFLSSPKDMPNRAVVPPAVEGEEDAFA
jgi:single-strand DNA-binding protein